MEAKFRKSAPSLKDKLLKDPYEFDFFQAVRIAERLYPVSKKQAFFSARFKNRLSLEFPPSALYDAKIVTSENDKFFEFIINFMGLIGPQGVMPRHYTEELLARWVQKKDRTTVDFLDIFTHRSVYYFYQAWKKNNFWIHSEEKNSNNHYDRFLLDFVGMGNKGLQNRLVKNKQGVRDQVLAYYSGILSQQPRSAIGLQNILEDLFETNVDVIQCYGKWFSTPKKNLTKLGQDNNKLGETCLLGTAFWDMQTTVKVCIGPLPFNRFIHFLPGSHIYKALCQFIRFYLGTNTDFQIEIKLKKFENPDCVLDSGNKNGVKLGWTSWIGKPTQSARAQNPIFSHVKGRC